MTDLTAATSIIAVPLVGIIWAIERLITVLSKGEVRIQNHIQISVKTPKDITVRLENNRAKASSVPPHPSNPEPNK